MVDLGDRRVLWQTTTGRWLPASAADGQGHPAVRARLQALGFLGGPIADLVPARSWWALWFPESQELWHARPLERTAGGFPFAAMRLTEEEAGVWLACNGTRTVAQVCEDAGVEMDVARTIIRRWTAVDVQALQLRERRVRPAEPFLRHLVAPPRPAQRRPDHHFGPEGETALERYHAEQITDGATHFDDRETTLAHAFAVPHPALGCRYGEALARLLGDEGPVLEIGPGTGELCEAFRRVHPHSDYIRLDLSPELLRTQEARCPGTRSVLGSATAIPLPDHSVGTVICNEVIADLQASSDLGGWSVTPEPGQERFNTGAWQMLREVARVLRPGGRFWVSEFGDLHELPTETTQLDHPEVSIHFDQLLEVAAQVGLQASVDRVADLLGMDRSARWLSRPSYEALRARMTATGQRLEARAWSDGSLELPWVVEGLHWVPITHPGAAPVVDRILSLHGERAACEGATG